MLAIQLLPDIPSTAAPDFCRRNKEHGSLSISGGIRRSLGLEVACHSAAAQTTNYFTWVTARNPARAGETILLRAANLSSVSPAPPTGYPTPSVYSSYASGRILPFDPPFNTLQGFPNGSVTYRWTCGDQPCERTGRAMLLQGEVSTWTIPIKLPESPFRPELPYRISVSYTLCPFAAPVFGRCAQENFTSSDRYPIYVAIDP